MQALLAEGEQLLARNQPVPAITLLQRALAADPSFAAVHHLLAIGAVLQGRGGDAVRHAADAVRLAPADARAHFTLGRAHKAAGELGAAITAYRRALEIEPRYAEAHVSLGIALKASGELDAAIDCYRAAIALNPGLAAAHGNLGNALAARAERAAEESIDDAPGEEVLEAQARAVALEPGNVLLQRNHGTLLLRARRRLEAAHAFNQALGADPGDIESCLRLGNCLKSLGDSKLARATYQKWLGLNPPNAPVMRALAGLLTRDGQADEGLEWAQKAATIDPDPYALMQLGSVLMQSRRMQEALAHCQRAVAASGGRVELYPTLLLGVNYLHEDPQAIFDAHAAFGRLLPPAAPLPLRPRAPGARLRVGYVSGDFVRHSVSYFISGLLERHDKDRFEVFCYNNLAWGDAVTERLKSYGHHWFDCEGISHEHLRRRIVADGIDILIDLAGHTSYSRMAMFALRAAPVQISYLGYPTVSGVPAMDFRITDDVIDAGDLPAFETEQPLRLPRTMFCYRPDEQPPIGPPPVLRAGYITFGSFNNIAKLTDHTLELWAQAMCAVPGSRLLLKSSSMAQVSNRENIERFMAERGVAPQRLSLQPWLAGKSSHLDLYNQVDIALDPYPYNGATTTCEALWMGVPVLTRRGRTHTSRMGASLLGAIGRSEWVADADTDFAAIAARVAADAHGRAGWRLQARATLAASPLFDERAFTHCFEALLERAWVLAGQPSQPHAAASPALPGPLNLGGTAPKAAGGRPA